MPLRCLALVLLVATLIGCTRSAAPPDASTAPAGFVNRVWTVRASNAVAPGQLYALLSDGTLVVASSTGTPSLGKWTYADGVFTMVEDGIAYRTDILALSRDELRLRSHNPGEPVELTLVPAETPPFAR